MTIEQLNSIIEIADTGSYSKAARNLHTTQPNLSYVVKNLEDQMDEKLFVRTSDGMIPTEKGSELIKQLRFLKNDYLLVDEIIKNKNPFVSRMSFNVATLNLFSVRSTFCEIVQKYKDIPINFTLNDYSTMSTVLSHINEVDFAMIGIIDSYVTQLKHQLDNLSVEYHPFIKLDCYAIVGKQNPNFGRKTPITIEELKKCTLVQYREDAETPQQSVAHVLGLANSSFGKVVVNHTDSFFEIIRKTQNVGIEFVSTEKFLDYNKLNDLYLIPIEGCNLKWEVSWIKKRQHPLTDIGAEFIETAKKAF